MYDDEYPHMLKDSTIELYGKHGIKKMMSMLPETDPDRQALVKMLKGEAKRTESRKNCKVCRTDEKGKFHICSGHYHDYEDCGRNDCFVCMIYARNHNADEILEKVNNEKKKDRLPCSTPGCEDDRNVSVDYCYNCRQKLAEDTDGEEE